MKHVHASQSRNLFVTPFILTLAYALVEFFGGIWAHSLALIGDAWHMFSDVLALGLAMMAAHQANKARLQKQRSSAELIAALLNIVLMLVVTAWVVIEAVERFNNPRPVAGVYVMLIAFVGLMINLIVAKQLHEHGDEKNLNQQVALLHVLGDILGSLAALAAGMVVYLTGWYPVDAILSLFISLLLFIVTIKLMRNIWSSF